MTHTLTGTVILMEPYVVHTQDMCVGSAGEFDDVAPGMPVVIRDQGGKTLGTSKLVKLDTSDDRRCHYSYQVPDVPETAGYQLQFGNHAPTTFSRSQLAVDGWVVPPLYFGLGG